MTGFLRRIAIALRFIKVLFGKKRVHDKITIRGNEEFINSTIEALQLLKEKVPEAYELVLKYVGDIVSFKPSRVFPDTLELGPTYVLIGASYSEGPVAEYAAGIAHEAYHCELYMKAKKENLDRDVPYDVYGGEQAEGSCLQYQCECTKKTRSG